MPANEPRKTPTFAEESMSTEELAANERRKTPTFAEESMSTKELAARVRDLENTLAATRAGMPLTSIPEHGAGPGMEINETWSQAEQEQAKM